MYPIEIAPAAERALKKLVPDVQKRIIKALTKLETEPWPAGVRKLSGEEAPIKLRGA